MIDITNMSFGYSKKKLLYKKINLHLEAGHIYGLLGKNGAGKSTLLKNIIGLLFPTEGEIRVNNHTPEKRRPAFLESIYFIPEEVYVPALTVEKYVNLFSPFYPKFNRNDFNRYMEELDVKTENKLTSLSFGQQKKFVIAFALACNTDILLLDEPTNGLDIPSKKRFRKLIASVMNESRTIFISTHQIRDLDHLIDQVIIIDEGDLLLNASINAIGEKLVFRAVDEISDSVHVLYSEESMKGILTVSENIDKEESKVNLEHLFSAVTDNPEKIKTLFHS
ncbi:MAG: ABC transporter ATP-binding protein [Chitinophagaceae bacterium]|nr:ABC transporter ATP-binding protein [Chitinophagaceae bacterium]